MTEGRCMMLLVVHTYLDNRSDAGAAPQAPQDAGAALQVPQETIRIISARHAKPHERRLYGNRKV
jgi:uncharacterized DUF497 family protein